MFALEALGDAQDINDEEMARKGAHFRTSKYRFFGLPGLLKKMHLPALVL